MAKKTEIRVEAEDAASSVFERIGDNAEREMQRVGDAGRLADQLSDSLGKLTERLGAGSPGAKQLAGDIRSASDSFNAMETAVTGAISQVHRLWKLLSQLAKWSVRSGGPAAGAAVATAAVAVPYALLANDLRQNELSDEDAEKFRSISAGSRANEAARQKLRDDAALDRKTAPFRKQLLQEEADRMLRLRNDATGAPVRDFLAAAQDRVKMFNASAGDRAEADARRVLETAENKGFMPSPAERAAFIFDARWAAEQYERMQKAADARLEAEEEIARHHEDLSGQAEKIREGLRDPQAVEQARLIQLASEGAINNFEFQAAMAQIEGRYTRETKSSSAPGTQGAPLLESHYLTGRGAGSDVSEAQAAQNTRQQALDEERDERRDKRLRHAEQLRKLDELKMAMLPWGKPNLGAQEMP